MEMRMMAKSLAPGVQHGQKTDLGTQVSRSAAMVRNVSAVLANSRL
jgi:hypothetical protein